MPPGPELLARPGGDPHRAYVRDFTFSRKPFGGRRDPPWDEAVRTGTFPRGVRDVYFRTELAFFDGGPMHVDRDAARWERRPGRAPRDAAPGLPGHVRELARAARSRSARDVATADGERGPNARGRAVHGRRRTQSAPEPDRSSARPRAADERRRDPVLRPHVTRHGGPGLRDRPLPLPLAGRRQARARGKERGACRTSCATASPSRANGSRARSRRRMESATARPRARAVTVR